MEKGIPPDKVRERILILRRYAYELENARPNNVKDEINDRLLGGMLPRDRPINIEWLASIITDEQLKAIVEIAVKHSPHRRDSSFRGRYYTVINGVLEAKGSWDGVKAAVREVIRRHGRKAYALLKALLETRAAPFTVIAEKASRIYGDPIYPSKLIAELRDVWDLVWSVGSRKYPAWAMPEEIKPAVEEALREFESKGIPRLSTRDAVNEYQLVLKMEGEFNRYLETLIRERLEETVEFGRRDMSPRFLAEYLRRLFGSILYLDPLLTITQQYSISDVEVVTEEGSTALRTGFNLALFGEPGTGKTFASKDLILGNDSLGLPPHGLPGLNRYCGGMTPVKFIRIGEAYEGRRFNFIVTEFNDWFKYRGMVEPLKLAMERGVIRYETSRYTVGPYRFTSFFSVNYNTRVGSRGYEVTVSDPNFNAIEDRMLCRLHRLTKERYRELSRSQMKLMRGEPQKLMARVAPRIRDHLTLVYAIETRHELVAGVFEEKRVLLTRQALGLIERASQLIIEHLESERVPFSMRLEARAIQLASALSLTEYFRTRSDTIPINPEAARIAARFLVEEAWVRSREAFPLREVIRRLSLE